VVHLGIGLTILNLNLLLLISKAPKIKISNKGPFPSFHHLFPNLGQNSPKILLSKN